MKSKITVKQIVAIGIGTAVFFILKRFVTIPTGVPNTDIATAYPFLALLGVIYGPIVAGLAGFLGHMIGDLTSYGAWWTWIVASGLLGVSFGLIGNRLRVNEGIFDKKDIITFIVGETIANVVLWMVLAPIGDVVIYAEAANKVFTQGVVIGLTNAVVTGIIGVLLIKAYAATKTKQGSLTKDA
ncbi:MAG: ECF-type riboflavin transporter substrate-binding protein [Bavariicoccus seileri]|uniref:ECF-type riboflavin transporter substrate-binding protein n=1 Tax=Bavariicoccus seileri TaxID=549685 RepID=UPI0003B78594|nr:ECF-type riboflavin transporter substrate-binding protein [Bavariicoccus seileri]